jgi:hypothetical protein
MGIFFLPFDVGFHVWSAKSYSAYFDGPNISQSGLNELEPKSKLSSWARKVDMYKLNSKVFNAQITHDHN